MLWEFLVDTCFSLSFPSRAPPLQSILECPGLYFCFSFPVRAPLVSRAARYLSLYPHHLQLSGQGTLCKESPRITPAHAHYSFSHPSRVPFAWRTLEPHLPMPALARAVLSGCLLRTAPQDAPAHTLCLPQLLCLTAFAESLEYWCIPTLFSALLPGHPL